MTEIDFITRATRLMGEFSYAERERHYERLFDLLQEVAPFQDAAIFLLDERKRKIELESSRGRPVDLVHVVEFEMGMGFSAWVASERRIVLLDNLKGRQAGDMGSFLSVPLLVGDDLVGVVNFGHAEQGAFTQPQAERVQVVASLLAGILAKNLLIARLQRQNEKIRRMNRKLKEAQQKLVEAEKGAAVSATVVSLNHEINNPLQIISGNLQLARQSSDNEEVKAKLAVAEEQLERVAKVLRKLREVQQPLFAEYIPGDEEKMIELGEGE
ncbi:MAG: GAF domain-containing protein [Candidatus Cloacimonetes bacterium]|nr:GAF domain-containing protein [Candidatus Cloacimonadota bacterium]